MKGIDISNNNGIVDFGKVKNDGVECVYIKATEGTTFVDSYANQFYNAAKLQGLMVGFYHFLVPTSAPETQADNFYNQIKKYKSDMIPMLDVEKYFDSMNSYAKRFIDRFEAISKIEIGIYSYSFFIKSYIDNSFQNYKLWEANYNNKPWDLPPNFFISVVGHQYSEKAKVSGVSGYCDINVFNNGVLLENSSNNAIAEKVVAENIYLTLQRELNRLGYKDKNGNELALDGIPGPLTLSACPLVKMGDRSSLVVWIQLRCGADPDGIFGGKTKDAVKWMQQKWNISDDGVVGPVTWAKLLGL